MPKITELTAITTLSSDDLLMVVDDPAGTPATKKITLANLKSSLALAKGDVGLGNVDNTSDAGKPVSTAQQSALDGKAASSHTHSLLDITDGGALAAKSSIGTGDIDNDAVTFAKIQNISAEDKILGRITAGTGDIEEITCTAAGRALLDDANAAAQRTTLGLGTLATQSGTFSGTSSGTNTGDQTLPTDATISISDVTTNNSSTTKHGWLPKLSNVSTEYINGTGAWSVPSGGTDPWTYAFVNSGSDFSTTSATAVDVTGLAFTPAANKTYEFEAMLMLRTATTTVNPRVGLAWPTGMTDGVAVILESQAATGTPLFASGNPNAALLVAVGGLPNTTQSWPSTIRGMVQAGASPSGTVKIQLASETAGTSVTIKAKSFIRYRTI